MSENSGDMAKKKKSVGRKKKPDYEENSFADRLLEVLKEHGLSLRQASKVCQVSPSTLDSWVRGSSPNDLKAVDRLCDELGVSFKWLLTGSHEKQDRSISLAELFEEQEFFDGIVRLRIDRMVPRKKGEDK